MDDLPLRPLAAAHLEKTAMTNGMAVYDQHRERAHHINAAGAIIVELCDGRHLVAEIIAISQSLVGQALDADEVRAFLRQARAEGLITW